MPANTIFPTDPLDPAKTTGLILCGMGGPDGPGSVRPFLRNLFSDPLIFPLPRLLAPALAQLIALVRAPAVRRRYLQVSTSGATPQLETTRRQADALAVQLQNRGLTTEATVAMRYWHPFSGQAVKELLERGAEQFLLVPAYPQYSAATGGSILATVLAEVSRQTDRAPVHTVSDWHLLPGYLDALAGFVIEVLRCWSAAGHRPANCGLLYVAHSLPASFIEKGDPYLDQTRATVRAIHQRVAAALEHAGQGAWLERLGGDPPLRLVFQSKVGPIHWLGPEVTEEVKRLADGGCRRLMIQPVSFTCEHVETLYELDSELKTEATALGIEEFKRGSALNLAPTWLQSLAESLAIGAFDKEARTHA